MTNTLSRVANATLAILIAAAIGNVAVAHAQTQVQGEAGPPAISTDCGSGTIEPCSSEKIFDCDWQVELFFNPATYSFGFKIVKSNCREAGSRPIYKDRYPKTTETQTCSGSSIHRGDEEEDAECS